MANVLTAIRMGCALGIVAVPAFSARFCFFCLLGGLTDALDGPAARRLGTASPRGAKFDTAADMAFALAVLLKLMTSLVIPPWLLIWIAPIAAVKAAGLIFCALRYRRFAALHSRLNKVCGAVVFAAPLFLGGGYAWQAKALAVIFACITASLAAVWECVSVVRGETDRQGQG